MLTDLNVVQSFKLFHTDHEYFDTSVDVLSHDGSPCGFYSFPFEDISINPPELTDLVRVDFFGAIYFDLETIPDTSIANVEA